MKKNIILLLGLFQLLIYSCSLKQFSVDSVNIKDCNYTYKYDIVNSQYDCSVEEIKSTLRFYYDNPPIKDAAGKVLRNNADYNSIALDSIVGQFLICRIDTNKYSYMIIDDTIKKINSFTIILLYNPNSTDTDSKYFNLLTFDTCNVEQDSIIQVGGKYAMTIYPYYKHNFYPIINSSTNVRIDNLYIMRVEGENVYTTSNIEGLYYKKSDK